MKVLSTEDNIWFTETRGWIKTISETSQNGRPPRKMLKLTAQGATEPQAVVILAPNRLQRLTE